MGFWVAFHLSCAFRFALIAVPALFFLVYLDGPHPAVAWAGYAGMVVLVYVAMSALAYRLFRMTSQRWRPDGWEALNQTQQGHLAAQMGTGL